MQLTPAAFAVSSTLSHSSSGHARIVNLSRNQQLPPAPNEERAFVKGYGSPMIPGIGQRIFAHITLQDNYLTSSVPSKLSKIPALVRPGFSIMQENS